MIDLKQHDLWMWQKRNFGTHDDDLMRFALGMSEEVGEVCHHILKGIQNIRGGINGVDKEQVADGIADTLIYGMQILSKLDMNAELEIEQVIDSVLKRDWKKDKTGESF